MLTIDPWKTKNGGQLNPSSAVASPHLFAKVAVPNLCTA
jgi:hypothetical protein